MVFFDAHGFDQHFLTDRAQFVLSLMPRLSSLIACIPDRQNLLTLSKSASEYWGISHVLEQHYFNFFQESLKIHLTEH